MPILSASSLYTAAGAAALSLSWKFGWPFGFLGSYCLIRALGHVQVGITRKLGVLLQEDNPNQRRLGLLERWYADRGNTRDSWLQWW